MRWAGHVARKGSKKNAYRALWWGKLKERGHDEYAGAGNRIILKLGLGTKPFGRRAHKREGNTETNIQ